MRKELVVKNDNAAATIMSDPVFRAIFVALYAKRDEVVRRLNRYYSIEDREDAVSEAFVKLLKKDPVSYGDKLPESEEAWLKELYWQARAYLSHLREHAEVHAKYVEKMASELEGVFACGHQGEEMDAEIRSRALVRALEMFRKDQDVSRRDLEIYTGIETGEVSGRELATRYHTTSDNVYVIKYRVGRLLRKHGPRCFERALKNEGYISFTFAA